MDAIKKKSFNRYIEDFNFEELFVDLGWDYIGDSFPKKAGDQTFNFIHVADKAGFAILICEPDAEGKIPDSQTRKKIHREIAKLHHEHLLIFVDKTKSSQQWELLIREPNKPIRTVSHRWRKNQEPELLYQKLSGAFFTLEEEEDGSLTIIDVVKRVQDNFGINAEKVTKRFYGEFKKQHTAFLDFIKGIDDHLDKTKGAENKNKQWYASLMLNRLMFCYFIQKKGFLNDDRDYLQNKLKQCREMSGNDKFYSFYRSFLLELFHDGLGKPMGKRKEDLPVDLGKIPYLNGGLFDVHELERQFEEIHIDDAAFEKIFEFFDKWEWHLDTREHAEGKTINPDVIGYIFEKYINERAAMGAYYTKEDITEYIGKNTILPFLFDETQRKHASAFKAESELWTFLKESGDNYIYDAVKKGVPQEGGLFDDLPEEVQEGFQPELEKQVVKESTSPHLWEIRKSWNQKAPESIALPTEIYRELIERRRRYAEVKEKITSGGIQSINDFITYNLNIRQFTQDFLETTTDAKFIQYFYKALEKITILDPTCGSGAFLFAALNILEPLYEICLKRMEEFAEEEPKKHKFFEETLQRINSEEHPNQQYFIYKSIILHNLYGVDIMKEAVEIAKLRLFLKLVSTVDVNPDKKNFGLEPLPDVDFNIRAGNTLVGFATEKELLETIEKKDALFAQEKLDEFKEEFDLVSKAFSHFQNSQLTNDQGSDSFRKAKRQLQEKLKGLNDKLNRYLATNYGIDADRHQKDYQRWLESHLPFHWVAEFYHIVAASNGFDVIIGNPPYVVYSSKSAPYLVLDYQTKKCANLYAYCTERAFSLVNVRGAFSFILPNSSISADKLTPLQALLTNNKTSWISSYAWRPAKLFEGANMLLSIIISRRTEKHKTYSSPYYRWYNENRADLFQNLSFNDVNDLRIQGSIPKVASDKYFGIASKIGAKKKNLTHHESPTKSEHFLYYFRAVLYWVKILNSLPFFKEDGVEKRTGEMKTMFFKKEELKDTAIAVLSSSLYFLYYTNWSSCQVINSRDLEIPFDFETLSGDLVSKVVNLSQKLQSDYQENSEIIHRSYSSRGRSFEMEKQYFYLKKSKPILDSVDTLLAGYYKFTEEELDFIINYDIKYRMGKLLYSNEEDGAEEDDELG